MSVIFRNEIDRAIRCVGNQLLQCSLGGVVNKWDEIDMAPFSFLVRKVLLLTHILLKRSQNCFLTFSAK